MLKKIVVILILLSIVSCTKKRNENSVQIEKGSTNNNKQFTQGEHKSIHQQEWEEHNKNSTSEINLEVTDIKVITTNQNKQFIAPHFSRDGNRLLFTTENYNGIWVYNLKKDVISQLNSLPGSGYKFEVSSDGDKVFFRNKTFTKNNRAQYSIVEQSIDTKKMNVIYFSKNVLTPPIQLGNELLFLENNKLKSYNLETRKITDNSGTTFIYVVDNKLMKFKNGQAEKISLNGLKPVSSKYSNDKKNIICLTATKGLLLLDSNGIVINNYPQAFSLSKLNNSNLVVFSEEKDNGKKIIKSEMYFGFTDSDKKISLTGIKDTMVFNPVWAPKENKISYNTNDGKIKIITLNIKSKEK